jgi:hypothetical protein
MGPAVGPGMRSLISNVLISSTVFALGCSQLAPEELAERKLGTSQSELTSSNGVTLPNGLTLANGFVLSNGVTLNNGFTLNNGYVLSNGINLTDGAMLNGTEIGPHFAPPAGSDLEKWIDVDPTMRKRILRYLIQCALPPTVSVSLVYRGLTESLGNGVANMGPELQTGPMWGHSQEKVSACLLARVNAKGESVKITMYSQAFRVASQEELNQFPVPEAYFYGNLFLPEPKTYFKVVGDGTYASKTDPSKCSFRACIWTTNKGCDCGVLVEDSSMSPYVGRVRLPSGALPTNIVYYPDQIDSAPAAQMFFTGVSVYVAPLPTGGSCTQGTQCASGRCSKNMCR